MTKVFVYGTLQAGHGNNRLLQGSEYIGRGLLSYHHNNWVGFALVDGPFPYLIRGTTKKFKLANGADFRGSAVIGEVYKVDKNTLQRLDALEGVDYDHYVRRRVKVKLIDRFVDDIVQAYVYVASKSTEQMLKTVNRPLVGRSTPGSFYKWPAGDDFRDKTFGVEWQ